MHLRSALIALAAPLLAAVAAAQCPTVDAFEPNDDCANAASLASGVTHAMTFQGEAAAGGSNADFYTLTLPPGDALEITCAHVAASGDLDIFLYDAANPSCGDEQSDLARGFTGDDVERVRWVNLTDAPVTYVLEVDQWVPQPAFDCLDYDLRFDHYVDPCDSFSVEPYEPNDSCVAAATIGPGLHTGLRASDGDPDHFSITVAPEEVAVIEVDFAGGIEATPRLQVFDSAGCVQEVGTVEVMPTGYRVTYVNTLDLPFDLYLVVSVAPGEGCTRYSLNWSSVVPVCFGPGLDDGWEDNEDCATATALGDGLQQDLFVSKLDEDLFEVTVAPGDTLVVDALFDVATIDLELYLYTGPVNCGRPQYASRVGTSVATGATVSSTNHSADYTRTVRVQVRVSPDALAHCGTYDLVVTGSRGDALESFCLGDGSAGACPCANESAADAGEGCSNSTGRGALLTASGTASVLDDDLHFTVAGARPGQPSLLVQGSSELLFPAKDGLLCLGNPVERMELVFLDATGAGATQSSIVTEGAVLPGTTRYYQQWYRDPGGVSPCATGSNFSNGVIVRWY